VCDCVDFCLGDYFGDDWVVDVSVDEFGFVDGVGWWYDVDVDYVVDCWVFGEYLCVVVFDVLGYFGD